MPLRRSVVKRPTSVVLLYYTHPKIYRIVHSEELVKRGDRGLIRDNFL